MLDTTAEVRTLYLLEDKNGHRIVRNTSWELNKAPCSHCGQKFSELTSMESLPGESETLHAIRLMKWRPKNGHR